MNLTNAALTAKILALGTLAPMIAPKPIAPPGVTKTVNTILSWAMWGGFVVCIVGFIMAGVSLALSNDRGTGNDSVKVLGKVAIGGVVIGSASFLAKAVFGI